MCVHLSYLFNFNNFFIKLRLSFFSSSKNDLFHTFLQLLIDIGINIQNAEHCSIEDARASMAIYRLVQDIWEADLLKTNKKQFLKHHSNDHSKSICYTDNCQEDKASSSSLS
ncbi:unnamed protein product [Schistosoma curassoni]|uniref:Exonuclease domain-containing protein n=1 Tax=Schistosoma curassoni TaxID=6186 RepID=A0A183K991_9TREM|nr:unnamed protein product [Schistosoma curassoni]